MTMFKKIALVAICAVLVSGCTRSARQVLGVSKSSPNEFSVVSNPPLSVPPSFSLVTPDSQAKAPIVDTSAKEILLEKKAGKEIGSISKGDKMFLAKAGADEVDPEIRNKLLADEAATVKEEKSLLDKVSFISKKENKESVVNAKKEKDRIAKNKEEGKEVTEGETPVVENNTAKSGWLNKVLGF